MKLLSLLLAGTALMTVAAHADEPGLRKAGQWQVTMTGPDGKAKPAQNFCWGPASINDVTKGMESCSKRDINKTGDVTVIDAMCTKGNQQITMHITITAASDRAYHSEMHMAYSPGIGNMTSVDVASDAKWLGPCPPGQTPSH